ncbi:MAG: FprA family A-type flavoprotein [Magnetovibrionaceae bacterium]
MAAVEIADGIHWVGALDPKLRSFDIILSTANGTTYNSYTVRGPNGVAVIDTVKQEFADEFFSNLEEVTSYDDITSIVLNHLEPDHTGALPELIRRAPQAQVYISRRAPGMLKALLKPDMEDFHFIAVDTGSELNLGGRTLTFLNTPYLHWPDTQCTFDNQTGTLFSGDLFGCHFCDERLFNDQVGDFRFSFEYYFNMIMRPFKEHVIDALDLIEPLEPKLVACAHGPILRDHPMEYIQRYHEMAAPQLKRDLSEDEKSLLIFYISAYGSTARMAEAIKAGAEEVPNVRVSLFDLEGGQVSPFIDLVEDADGLAFGSPTINGDAAKPIWDLLSSCASIKTQGKMGAAFGSYGWTGEAVEMIEARMRGLKLRVPVAGLKLKLTPSEQELVGCEAFGKELAEHLTGQNAPRVIDLAALG